LRQCERNKSADTNVSEEGEGRMCSRSQSRESSLAGCDEDHGEAGCTPAVHAGPWWSRCPPVAHGRDPTLEQVDARRRLSPRGESYTGAGSWQLLRTCG